MADYTITLPHTFPEQTEIINDPARFRVVCCGRRFGKTMLSIELAIFGAIDPKAKYGGKVGIFVPTYKDLIDTYRRLVQSLGGLVTRANSSEYRIEVVANGVIEFWSMENVDAGRGRRYNLVIVDEAAKARHLEEIWQNAIRPTLADFEGKAIFLSTPRGLNFFWKLYQNGLNEDRPNWKAWQYDTYTSPHILDSEIDAAKDELPSQVFRQEYLAEFLTDGSLIQNVEICATAPDNQQWIVQGRYVIGVDWGKLNDYSVAIVMDAKTMVMVDMIRFNQISYPLQAQRIKELYNKWSMGGKRPELLVETNSIGEPMLDQLNHDGVPAKGFTTTQISKAQIINQLILAFEKKSIRILNDQILRAELQAYEAVRLPGGGLKYGAPPGFHDDTVMSLAIAVQACADVPVMVLQQESDPYGVY